MKGQKYFLHKVKLCILSHLPTVESWISDQEFNLIKYSNIIKNISTVTFFCLCNMHMQITNSLTNSQFYANNSMILWQQFRLECSLKHSSSLCISPLFNSHCKWYYAQLWTQKPFFVAKCCFLSIERWRLCKYVTFDLNK